MRHEGQQRDIESEREKWFSYCVQLTSEADNKVFCHVSSRPTARVVTSLYWPVISSVCR